VCALRTPKGNNRNLATSILKAKRKNGSGAGRLHGSKNMNAAGVAEIPRARRPRVRIESRGLAPSSAGSAVDLMEASFFRSFDPVNGARSARRLGRSKTIDRAKTSEVHASMRSTAWCATERGGAAPVAKVWRRLRVGKFGNSHPVRVIRPAIPIPVIRCNPRNLSNAENAVHGIENQSEGWA